MPYDGEPIPTNAPRSTSAPGFDPDAPLWQRPTRLVSGGTFPIPQFGWAYRTPLKPTHVCRWCGCAWRFVVTNTVGTIRVCPACDTAPAVDTPPEGTPV